MPEYIWIMLKYMWTSLLFEWFFLLIVHCTVSNERILWLEYFYLLIVLYCKFRVWQCNKVTNTVYLRYNKHGFKRIPRYTEQYFSVPSFLTMKTLIQILGLTNTAFNNFPITSNKNIDFLLKIYHGFSKTVSYF